MHHHNKFLNISLPHKGSLPTQPTPVAPHPSAPCSRWPTLRAADPHSAPVHSPTLDTSCKWNRALWPLVTGSFHWACFCCFISHCGMPVLYSFFLPNNRFHYIDIPHFIYSFIARWAFAVYPLFGNKNNAAMSIHKTLRKSFVWTLKEKCVWKDFISVLPEWFQPGTDGHHSMMGSPLSLLFYFLFLMGG